MVVSLAWAAAVPSSSDLLTPAQLQEDEAIVRASLEEGHPGVYRFTEKPKLDALFERASACLRRPMTSLELYRLLAPVVAQVKCGHTRLEPSNAEYDEERTVVPLLPLYVRVLGGQAYGFRDYANPDHHLAGAEILAINGVSIRRILSSMTAATSRDGNVLSSASWRISGRAFPGLLHALMGIDSPFRIDYRDPATRKSNMARMTGIRRSEWDRASGVYPQDFRRLPAADLRFLDDGRIAVMTIRIWSGYVDQQRTSLPAFFQKSFDQLESHATKVLIIDVRGNPGGDDEPGRQLFAYLTDKPLPYYRDLVVNNKSFEFLRFAERPETIPTQEMEKGADGKLHYTKHANWGLQPPSSPTFQGRVIVLQNGASFSASAEFADVARTNGRAIFIGEENGGGYDGNNSGFMPYIELPNSHLQLRVAMMSYYMAVNDDNPRDRGVLPDYPVHYTIQELISGTDKEMALALDLARE